MELFTARSIWTMLHGIVLGGLGLMALAAMLFTLVAAGRSAGAPAAADQSRSLAWLSVFAAAVLWLTVIGGTYIVFPPYRATPPEGLVELSEFPRSFLLASPETAWLHAFAMETKEHVPWIAAILSTAVAFVGLRHRSRMLEEKKLWRVVTSLTAISFFLVSYVALLGVFVNKVAPLE